MLEFSNLIKVIPCVQGGSKSSTVYEFIADAFSFTPKITETDSGCFWDCDKTFIVDIPKKDVIRFFSVERSALVELKTSNGKNIELGSHTIPARVQISSNLNSANLVIKCKMLTDPFL